MTPADIGLAYESMRIESDGVALPAWFIPARGGAPGPGVVLVHGWESARDRTLPLAVFLHAAGFHCLTFDVRGNGANPAEDAAAQRRRVRRRRAGGVSRAGRAARGDGRRRSSGHSMGGIGAILAAAADPRVAALVATSTPADPYRLTRLTFRLAQLPLPDPIAYPLAWLTTRVYLRPRGHDVDEVSASAAIARYEGPVLLAHGDEDTVVPTSHLARLAAAGRGDPDRRARSRAGRDAGHRGRPALVAVRGRRAIAGRSPRSWRARSAGRSTRRRPAIARPPRLRTGSPTPRLNSRPSRTCRAGSARWRRSRCRGRRAGRRPTRTTRAIPASATRLHRTRCCRASRRRRPGSHRDGVLVGSRRAAIAAVRVVRALRRPAARRSAARAHRAAPAVMPAAARTSSAGRSSSCRERAHLEAAGGRRSVGRPPGRGRGRRSRSSRPTRVVPDDPLSIMLDLGRAAQNMVLAAWEARDRERAGDRLRARPGARLLGYPRDQHCEYVLSFGYPADPDDLTRPPKAGGRRALDEIVRQERW